MIVANHNSHLDTMVLMSMLPLGLIHKVKPVAAADYFLRNALLGWFAMNIIGILPLKRKRTEPNEDLLAPVSEALKSGNILIFFPEGSRGEAEKLSGYKTGVARIAERHPEVPVVPIFLHGLGKALPKGEGLLVPFFCDVFVGEPLQWSGSKDSYMKNLDDAMKKLADEGKFPEWQ